MINLSIINAVMVPHPPLIIPDVGKGGEKKINATVEAYEKAAAFVAGAQPDTIILITPHSVMYADWFHISPGESARGSFASFGAGNVIISADYDREFVTSLSTAAKVAGFPVGTEGQRDASLDHASMVPLYFLGKAYGDKKLPKVIRIGLSGLPLTDHYKFGMLIKDTAKKLGRKVSVVASGDLSHCLEPDGPYGYKKEGPQYDARIMDVMERAAFFELFSFGDDFCESAGECGHRSFVIMAGCFDGIEVNAKKLSYEGPFGVGYGVCLFTPGKENSERLFLKAELEVEAAKLSERKSKEDVYVRLARLAVETYVKSGKRAALPPDLPDDMIEKQAGTFVSLHMRGQLRGCIGTTGATAPSIAWEIIQNGISACSRDPRFSPVRVEELPIIEYSVDVLGEPEEISSPAELDVRKYGVIVTSGHHRGLLLPDLDGVDTVEDQIAIAKKKAGINPGEKVSLQRFTVIRHV